MESNISQSARPPNQQPAQQPPQNQFQSPPPQQPPPSYHQFDPRGGPPPQFQARFQGPGGPHGFPGQPGAVPGFHPGFGGPPPPNFYGPPPGAGFIQHQPPQGSFPPQQTPIGPPEESRPSPNAKPEAIQASRLAAAQKPAEMSGTPVPTANTGPPPPLESKPAAKAAAAQATNTPAEKQPAAKKTNNRVAVPLAAPKVPPKPTTKSTEQPASYADATQAATAAVAAAMAQLAPSQQTQPDDNLAQKVGQMRLTHDANTRGRGRGRGAGPPRGGRAKPVDVPKEDFDFESSNAKFNKQDLAKEAIASDSPVPTPPANTAGENGHADDDVVIPPKPSAEKGYDKKTSFFDNISSDLKDRTDSQTIDGRAMRNQERNRNMETFGQGSVDGGHRGGYRGRGRGRGLGRGRGGPRGGFDGPRGNSRGRGRNTAEGETPA